MKYTPEAQATPTAANKGYISTGTFVLGAALAAFNNTLEGLMVKDEVMLERKSSVVVGRGSRARGDEMGKVMEWRDKVRGQEGDGVLKGLGFT